MPRFSSVIVSTALALIVGFVAAEAQAADAPCAGISHHSRLLEWVGRWRVTDDSGAEVGEARLETVAGACAFTERVTRGDGNEEFGLIFFDRSDAVWRERWVSSLGLSGTIDLDFERDSVSVSGRVQPLEGGDILMRSTITSRPGAGFTQRLELSLDGGATYSDPELTHYLPWDTDSADGTPQGPVPAAEAPAPAPLETPSTTLPVVQPVLPAEDEPSVSDAAPTEAPEAPEAASAGVRVRSKRKSEAPVPETAMESPMTLEFELGPLADLPPGAAWRTEELAPYVADEVNIPRVTVQRRQRRGRNEVELVVNLRTRAGQSKVDLEVTLFTPAGDVVSERAEGIALGKLIRAHDPTDGLAQTVRLPVEVETFDALFADGARPSVRLTVTVR